MTWSKASRQSRGYGAQWERTRALVLRRDNGLCQRCLRANRVQAGNEVHHIKPKAQGGTDEDTNLETLCHDCHEEADAKAQGKTLKTGCDIHGMPLDPAHPWNKPGGARNLYRASEKDRPPRFAQSRLYFGGKNET